MGNILLWVTFWYLGEQKLNTKLGQGNKFPKLGKIPHYWKKTEQNKQEKTQHNSLPDKPLLKLSWEISIITIKKGV